MGTKTDSTIIVNEEHLVGLLKEQLAYDRFWNKCSEAGLELSHDVCILQIIWDALGFPKDETILKEDGYCRDWLHDMWAEYRDAQCPNLGEYMERLISYADQERFSDN